MAANSKRELILAKLKTTLDAVSSLNHVERKPLKGISDLEAYPSTQIPVAVILGGMPSPNENFSERTRKLDKVRSTLTATIIVYAMDNENPDSKISTLADDLWSAIYADITLGYSWILGLRIVPDVDVAFWEPYCAFSFAVDITYIHDKEGI